MQTFLTRAAPAAQQLVSAGRKLEQEVDGVFDYFGEDGKRWKPDEKSEKFFDSFVRLARALTEAEDHVRAKSTKGDLLKVPQVNGRAGSAEESAKTGGEVSSSSVSRQGGRQSTGGRKSIGRGGLDDVIHDLHTGSILQRQRTERKSDANRRLSRIFLDGSR